MLSEENSILTRMDNQKAMNDENGQKLFPFINSKKRNYTLSLLCAIFGMGSWLAVNSIYTQMPLLVQLAPEMWSLPSYLSVVVQISNIVPLLYFVFRKRIGISDSILISFFLLLGTVSLFALAFTYDITYPVFDNKHSVYFFIWSFLSASVGCISSVLFLPFMNKIPEMYLIPFFVGEGLSSFIPSVFALLQGVNKEISCVNTTVDGVLIAVKQYQKPNFSITIFLLIMSALTLFAFFSFVILNYFSMFAVSIPARDSKTYTEVDANSLNQNETSKSSVIPIPTSLMVILLSIQTVINCFSNGILPSIQSYSCLPYGTDVYHFSIILNQIISPTASFFAFFLPVVSLRFLGVCVILGILCITYESIAALMSPLPPLIQISIGKLLIVFVWMLGSTLISYIKLSIAAILRKREKNLLVYGVVTQLGSTIGAGLSFVLINYANLFHSAPSQPCN